MAVIIGSARHNERGNLTGGRAGDQTGQEVMTQKFYVSSKGWIVLRPKTAEIANRIGDKMYRACGNPNIGYCQGHRNGVVNLGIDTTTPTECDCSSLVRQCVREATGKDPGNFTTATEKNILYNTGLFDYPMSYTNGMKLYKGDILVTKTKGHTVIVTSSDYKRGGESTPAPVPAPSPVSNIPYRVGVNYTLQVELKVRTGAGTNYAAKRHSQLTSGGQTHDRDRDGALDKGTVVTCKEVKMVGNDIWMRCPSGWIAAIYHGKTYVK